jgi:hypothetical protein
LPARHGHFILGQAVAFGQAAAYRIFANHLVHAQQGRVDAIPAQGRDVRIAVMAGENTQQHSAKNVPHGEGVGLV